MRVEKEESVHFAPREFKVLRLLADGKSNREIAVILPISEQSVKNYVSSIMEKTESNNRTQAVVFAINKGLVKSKPRRDEAVRLREAGLTYAKIGSRFGISKERVRQVLKGKPISQKPALDSKVMLTTSDVAQLLGLHSNTVRRWEDKGVLRAYRVSSRGDRRFRREDIDGFLKERETAKD